MEGLTEGGGGAVWLALHGAISRPIIASECVQVSAREALAPQL